MLLLAVIATVTTPSQVGVMARATVRIYSAAKVTSTEWEKAPALHKREKVIRGDNGERLRLRLIEYE